MLNKEIREKILKIMELGLEIRRPITVNFIINPLK